VTINTLYIGCTERDTLEWFVIREIKIDSDGLMTGRNVPAGVERLHPKIASGLIKLDNLPTMDCDPLLRDRLWVDRPFTDRDRLKFLVLDRDEFDPIEYLCRTGGHMRGDRLNVCHNSPLQYFVTGAELDCRRPNIMDLSQPLVVREHYLYCGDRLLGSLPGHLSQYERLYPNGLLISIVNIDRLSAPIFSYKAPLDKRINDATNGKLLCLAQARNHYRPLFDSSRFPSCLNFKL
jgi:hypothetical protein